MNRLKPILFGVLAAMLGSCSTYFNQPLDFENARFGENTEVTGKLRDLPPPVEPVVVGVYKFRDQTGQYKPTDAGSTFSTAVTQGATTILIKALEDSQWFVPIERENLSNLLNERNIIRNTRKEYRATTNPDEPQLPPLLYAGVLLEGGIVSYDSNIITGGAGARYFGVGASTRYRQDRVTIYLRAVSTSSGKILKTVYVSKTILSQALDGSIFRYVKLQRLLEAETGFTRNEPVQLAITEAIEKAVEGMIVEGIKDELWTPKATKQEVDALVANYEYDLSEDESTKLYNRLFKERRATNAAQVHVGGTLIDGDYPDSKLEYMVGGTYRRFFTPYFNMSAGYTKFTLGNKGFLNEGFMSLDINAEVIILPYDRVTPFGYIGGGLHAPNGVSDISPKVQAGGGIEYLIKDNLGIRIFGEQNLVFSDEVDGVVFGSNDDFYTRFGFGLNFYF